ncbi:MAG: NADH-quinone oxidoreductase subunit [Crocinitomicaceae bacterium]|jgi:NADH-quinone oxidoreductase subunit C|nr:NADH-quinone oxidoreductase subunit [Crocinitomicaceae bacterium]
MTQNSLTNESVFERIKAQFGEGILAMEEPYGMLTLEVKPETVHDLVKWLKEDDKFQVSFLTLLGGIHYPENTGKELGVNYHLHSLVHNFRIRLRAYFPIENPEIDSITDIHTCANWMERETYDFYGIQFKGHPNLVRILNEDTMDYFPMRKEYHLEDATREDKDDRFFGR